MPSLMDLLNSLTQRTQQSKDIGAPESQPYMNIDAYYKWARWPGFADAVSNPNKLRDIVDGARYSAWRGSGGHSEMETERAMRAIQALKEVWGIDYESPRFDSKKYIP